MTDKTSEAKDPTPENIVNQIKSILIESGHVCEQQRGEPIGASQFLFKTHLPDHLFIDTPQMEKICCDENIKGETKPCIDNTITTDLELIVMNHLVDVMEHMNSAKYLTKTQRGRIVAWFHARYNGPVFENNQQEVAE